MQGGSVMSKPWIRSKALFSGKNCIQIDVKCI